MAVSKSTKFCNVVVQNMVNTPVAVFTLNQVRIFSGLPPTTADAVETGTLLCIITEPAYATLTWLAAAVDGVLSKSANVWAGVAGTIQATQGDGSLTPRITSGTATAGYFRICSKADTGAVDNITKVWPRLQGVCNQSGGELVLSSTTITFGATTTVTAAAINITPN